MADVKDFKMPGWWANNAYTTIPNPPVTGIAYRNTAITQEEIEQGQRYGSLGDSATWNQLLWAIAGIAKQLEEQGVLSWSPLIDYAVGALVMGTDGNLYVAKSASGPSTAYVNPVGDETGTWKAYNSGGGGGLVGEIVAFSGSFGGTDNRFPIPLNETAPVDNFCLCDGVTTNGLTVPDLRGRMILCANTTYPQGSKGGTTVVSGTVGEATLAVSQLAAHNHLIYRSAGGAGNANIGNGPDPRTSSSYSELTGGGAAHAHSFYGNTYLPPYYALAYIMRIS